MGERTLDILLVEDSEIDAELIREACSYWECPPALSVVSDGELALNYLRDAAERSRRPDLVLLDLNLPKKNGFEVLREIRQSDSLTRTPVIVLSTSERERDVNAAYELHANCYLSKPLEFEAYIQMMKALENLWCSHARLPAGPAY